MGVLSRLRAEHLLARLVTGALFVSVMAGAWDAWWHGVIGRESFWSPPHILLYASTMTAVLGAVIGWWQHRSSLWKRLAIVLLLVPASAPFDELWHRAFGVESIGSPIIVWSPPHLVLIGALLGGLLMLLPILARDPDPVSKHLFMGMGLAAALELAMFPLAPFLPTGPWHMLGFWGTAPQAAAFALILLVGIRMMPGPGAAMTIAAASLLLQAMTFGEQFGNASLVPPHPHPPGWLVVFSVMAAALAVDMTSRWPAWLKGALAGFVWSAILYGAGRAFVPPEFSYGVEAAATAVVAAAVGGVIAGAGLGALTMNISGKAAGVSATFPLGRGR